MKQRRRRKPNSVQYMRAQLRSVLRENTDRQMNVTSPAGLVFGILWILGERKY